MSRPQLPAKTAAKLHWALSLVYRKKYWQVAARTILFQNNSLSDGEFVPIALHGINSATVQLTLFRLQASLLHCGDKPDQPHDLKGNIDKPHGWCKVPEFESRVERSPDCRSDTLLLGLSTLLFFSKQRLSVRGTSTCSVRPLCSSGHGKLHVKR